MDLRAKKSLGQNFLTATHIVDEMVQTASVKKGDVVLEIGPGKGVLTKALLSQGANVVAIEKDHRMVEYLHETFEKECAKKQLVIIEGDATTFDQKKSPLYKQSYKIVANIPYNVTGKILSYFLSGPHKPTSMTLMIQHEVAKRIVAKDQKESILSISVKAFGIPSYVRRVSAGAFFPKPKVDSAILHIANISNKNIDEGLFFNIIKNGFAHKRKKLFSNLAHAMKEVSWVKIFKELAILENTRAEDLPLSTWITLSEKVKTNLAD